MQNLFIDSIALIIDLCDIIKHILIKIYDNFDK